MITEDVVFTDNPALDRLVELGVIAQENVAEFMEVTFITGDHGYAGIYDYYPDGPPEWFVAIREKCKALDCWELYEQAHRVIEQADYKPVDYGLDHPLDRPSDDIVF